MTHASGIMHRGRLEPSGARFASDLATEASS